MEVEKLVKANVKLDNSKKIILNIVFASNQISERAADILKPYDLSIEQYNVLRILRGQKGNPANMCIIQERMVTKTSNTTRLVDKLLLKNLVSRTTCEANRRKIEVKITAEGLDLLNEIDPKIHQHENNFAEKLNLEEQEQLINLLEKYRK
jgi:DNA-binding MarR family transcriptional regulator